MVLQLSPIQTYYSKPIKNKTRITKGLIKYVRYISYLIKILSYVYLLWFKIYLLLYILIEKTGKNIRSLTPPNES